MAAIISFYVSSFPHSADACFYTSGVSGKYVWHGVMELSVTEKRRGGKNRLAVSFSEEVPFLSLTVVFLLASLGVFLQASPV